MYIYIKKFFFFFFKYTIYILRNSCVPQLYVCGGCRKEGILFGLGYFLCVKVIQVIVDLALTAHDPVISVSSAVHINSDADGNTRVFKCIRISVKRLIIAVQFAVNAAPQELHLPL